MAMGMRKGVFGKTLSHDFRPIGIGDGIEQQRQMDPPMPEPEKKSGLFGQGGFGRYMAGAIGDVLLQNADMQPMFMPAMEAQRNAAAVQAQAQMQRAQELADYRVKKGIDAEFREPQAPDTFERTLLGAGIDPASPQARELYRRRADSMAQGQDEFVVVPIPGRGTYAGPKSGLPSALGQAPQAPVGKLTPIGGGTAGNSGGGFPSGR